MSRFYVVVAVGECGWDGCRKLASHKVMASGNVSCGGFCMVHAGQKQKSLERYYKKLEKENSK